MTQSQRRRDLTAYFVLTFAFSWAIEIPLALSERGLIAARIPMALHYAASFGPMLAAVVITLARQGFAGLRGLFGGLSRWRVGREGALFALLLSPALLAAVAVATRLAQGTWPDLGALGVVDYIGAIGVLPALGLWLLTFGLGEETGWRGFALPRLQASRSALSASLVLGAFWAAWHLPALFYRDTYREMGWMVVPMLFAIAVIGSVLFTWLYNGTRGSLLMVVLFHGLFDFCSTWQGGIVPTGMLITIAMAFWAVRAYKVHGPATLAPSERVVR